MRGRRSEVTASTSAACNSSKTSKKCSKSQAAPTTKMEMYDHFYTNFVRPPFAPVYTPTAEEFADPIEYVAKIKDEAEKYGVVKIIPPPCFKPPFAIDKSTFLVKTRTQKLNEVEAIVKEKHTFVERVINYNKMSGVAFELPADSDGRLIDLHRLHRIVQKLGGCEYVNDENKWDMVAKEMIPPTKAAKGIPAKFVKLLKNQYNTFIEPFVRNLKETNEGNEDESDDEMEQHDYQHNHGNHVQKNEDDLENGETQKKSPKKKQSRMMAGGLRKQKNMGKKKLKPKKHDDDPMDTVFCITCDGGMDEDKLILCDMEDCNNGRHTYCCDPPLEQVPEGEWKCPKCIEAEDSKIGLNWGFYEDHDLPDLNSFSDYANNFKRQYFDVSDPKKVKCEDVEAEYWKNIISSSGSVKVRYGADLITSECGSGFPKKDEKYTGTDAKSRQHYANHPWNLNNMPVLKESVLSHFDHDISGMMIPWIYVGMCFSTFCWHTEDHWTYSVNYNHWGERKIWYGISGDDAEKFENAVRSLAPGLTSRMRDIFHHMNTAANPALLRSMGVPVYTVHQNAGEFVITFPRAYHAGYNEGLNMAEAVNFAPVDWLNKGRLCMQDYGKARRTCVFAHDELVLRMVNEKLKLGISMSVAVLDELLEIQKREQVLRASLLSEGVKQKVSQFEEWNEDRRVCRFCRTAIYVSGLTCAHRNLTCLEHTDHLCKECSYAKCTLLIRFKLEDFVPMVEQLENRTNEYYSWQANSNLLLHDGDKPELKQIEDLVDVAKQNRFPTSGQMAKLISIRQQTKNAIEKAKVLLNGKVKTRERTRKQRADPRLDLEGVRNLIEDMKMMTCELGEYIEKLEELVERVEEWVERAKEAVEAENEKCDENEEEKLEKLVELAKEGEEFDIKLEELEQLNKIIKSQQWIEKASELLKWKPTANMEMEDDFYEKERRKVEEVKGLVREGNYLMKNSEKVKKLQKILNNAIEHDNIAGKYLEQPEISKIIEVWETVRESDWLSEHNIDSLRDEIVNVYEIINFTNKIMGKDSTNLNLSDRLNSLSEAELKSSDASDICTLCQQSRVIRNSDEHKHLLEMKLKVENFIDKLVKLFKPPNCYYNLYEIISEREDVVNLINGENNSISLYTEKEIKADEWEKLSEFSTISEMMCHQEAERSEQVERIDKLQIANTSRGISACSCLGTEKIPETEPVICCILCRANYHVQCCEYTPFLNNLPEGTFLCVRCLKGKRPILDDLLTICKTALGNFYEHNLVRRLINISREIYAEMSTCLDDNCENVDGCKKALIRFLSCEVLNTNALPKANEIIRKVYGDFIEKQLISFRLLRDRASPFTPKYELFVAVTSTSSHAPKRSGKRNSTVNIGKEIAKKSKRRSNGESCESENCHFPESDWVQCDGCDGWYHYDCVGVCADVIQRNNFFCGRCVAASAGSTGSPSSSDSTSSF